MPDRNSLWEEKTVWFGLKQSPLWQEKHDIWIDLVDGDGSLQMAMHVWCLQRSEEVIRPPGLQTAVHHYMNLGPLEEQPVLLITESSNQHPN